jgi:hypothetical protein
MLMAKAGAKVPADRKAGVVAGYRDLKQMAARCCASPGPRPTSRRTSSA